MCSFLCISCSDGCVCAFNTAADRCMPQYQRCHTSVVHSVDFNQSVIISGSRDTTVRVGQSHCRSDKVDVNLVLAKCCNFIAEFGLCHNMLSSVTRVYSGKTSEARITQFFAE